MNLKIELDNGRMLDTYGNIVHIDKSLFDLMYNGVDISKLKVFPSEDIKKFNDFRKMYNKQSLEEYKEPTDSIHEYDKKYQDEWFIPEEYMKIDVLDYIIDKCSTEEQYQRVAEEYELFLKHDMINVLRLMIFLVDSFRKNNIVWGVGRGSSVASYILYLIGIHRIDSLKYNIPYTEFFHE